MNALYEVNQSSLEVSSTGGKLLKYSSALVGPQTIESINKFNPDYAILSCKALNKQGSITDSNEDESHIKSLMIEKANKVILAVDSSKIDKTSFITFGHITDIDYIVSDIEFDNEWKDLFEKYSIEILN